MAAALGNLNTTTITSILQFGLPGSGLQLKRRIGRRNGRFCRSRQYGKAFVRRSGLKALAVGGRRQSGRHSLSPNTRKLKLHTGIHGKANTNLKCNELSALEGPKPCLPSAGRQSHRNEKVCSRTIGPVYKSCRLGALYKSGISL